MISPSLPSLPTATDNNLLGRLLVSPGTQDELVWALMSRVDLSSEIDGKPLLQVFCENHKNNSVYRMPLPEGSRLPAALDEDWPNPRDPDMRSLLRPGMDDRWPSPKMWLAAALILHSPDPFAWKTKDGYDIVDFVVSWRNDHLLNQLMRMPGAPTSSELDRRKMLGDDSRSYLHSLVSQDHGGPYMLNALLSWGLNPDMRDSKGRTPLHVSRDKEYVASLLAAGADPWATDKAGLLAVDTWVAAFLAPASTNGTRTYAFVPMLREWLKHIPDQDRHRVAQVAAPAVGMALKRDRRSIANEIAEATGVSLAQATYAKGDKKVGILPFLVAECARRRKSVALTNLSEVLGTVDREDLEKPDARGIPLLAWIWAAAASSSEGTVGAMKQEEAIHDRLRQILCASGMDQKAARLELLEQALGFVDQKPFKGKGLDETIAIALSNQVQRMVKEASSPQPDGDLTLVAEHPHLLGLMLNDKVRDNLVKQALDVLPLVAAQASQEVRPRLLLSLCHAAKVNAISSPRAASGVMQAFVSAFEELQRLDVRWDHQLPAAAEALAALRSAGTRQEALSRLAGQLEEQSMERHTGVVLAPATRGPRL